MDSQQNGKIASAILVVAVPLLAVTLVACSGSWESVARKSIAKALVVNQSVFKESWPVAVKACEKLAVECRRASVGVVVGENPKCQELDRCLRLAKAFTVASTSIDEGLFKAYQVVTILKDEKKFNEIMLDVAKMIQELTSYASKLKEFVK